jgi:hypothetical protein
MDRDIPISGVIVGASQKAIDELMVSVCLVIYHLMMLPSSYML